MRCGHIEYGLLTARESSKCFYDCIDCSTVINIAILAYVPCDLVRVIAMQGWETFSPGQGCHSVRVVGLDQGCYQARVE